MSDTAALAATHRAIDATWRAESPRIVAALMRMLRDLDLAEDVAQDALLSALEQWPRIGVPANAGAWLMATAKNRAIDRLRRLKLGREKLEQYGVEADDAPDEGALRDAALDDDIGDDLLRLVFTACHPVLAADARVALTLKLLGGLTTAEIARAFLSSEPTIAQRIVRAKRTLADAAVPFEVPRGAALAERLDSVLDVLYLVFNEGYSATAGDDWTRPRLCDDAIRLTGLLAGLMPREPEVHALHALMLLQASRLPARTDADGAPVLLLEQDRTRWDRIRIRDGLAALERAQRLGGSAGAYALQAAIAACHARASTAEATHWARIAALYDALAQVAPSPVVELNRAVAHGMAHGPRAGLAIADALHDAPSLRTYHLLPLVRGDLLEKLDRRVEARAEFERAAALVHSERERALLLARAAACG